MQPSPRSTRLVLVADDSALVRQVLSQSLKKEGIGIVAAESGAHVLAVDPRSLSCALLDLDLGDATGVDLAVRLLKEAPELPIAFFSASVAAEQLVQARTMGQVFVKPDELHDALAWAIARAKG
jgi:CheY-like chemotaxis protein